MIQINDVLCIGCLKCTAVCPFTVLESCDGKPVLNPNKPCMKCMHCAAACPKKAISCSGKPAVEEKPVEMLPENFSGLLSAHLLSRRSYRHFKDVPLSKELLSAAFALADWAPSAKNQHPANYIVVSSREEIAKIMAAILDFVKETGASPEILSEFERGNNVVTGTAPTLILAYADSSAVNPPVDTALALSAAELYLQARGVGTCWAGYLTRMCNTVPVLKEFFALPEGCQFYGSLMAGYPEGEQYLHLPVRVRPADIRWI